MSLSLNSVADEAKNLAEMLQEVLNRVITTYDSYNMPLPPRRYWTLSTPAIDCEQIVVSLIQLYIGSPGDEANEPRRCNDPRSATINITIARSVPVVQQNGQPPSADVIQEASLAGAYDAWILLQSVNLFDAWEDYGSIGLGVIATVDADPAEGGLQVTRMTLTLAVP
jgi:hypothetical protein